jgi:hypothetical protein
VQLRDSEHNGRINIERELRRVVAAKMQDGVALYYSPIGHVSLCFKRCSDGCHHSLQSLPLYDTLQHMAMMTSE